MTSDYCFPFQKVDFDHGQREFQFEAYATDPNPGRNNSNRANTTVTVTITDYNDETPIFDPIAENPISVAEDLAVNTLLVTVTATDKDVDPAHQAFE